MLVGWTERLIYAHDVSNETPIIVMFVLTLSIGNTDEYFIMLTVLYARALVFAYDVMDFGVYY